MILSNCAICGNKKSRFTKKQVAKGLLRSLGLKIPLHWYHYNDIEMYSLHNEGKSVVAGRFIGTLKNKIHKYMTLILRNVYIDKLGDI